MPTEAAAKRAPVGFEVPHLESPEPPKRDAVCDETARFNALPGRPFRPELWSDHELTCSRRVAAPTSHQVTRLFGLPRTRHIRSGGGTKGATAVPLRNPSDDERVADLTREVEMLSSSLRRALRRLDALERQGALRRLRVRHGCERSTVEDHRFRTVTLWRQQYRPFPAR